MNLSATGIWVLLIKYMKFRGQKHKIWMLSVLSAADTEVSCCLSQHVKSPRYHAPHFFFYLQCPVSSA
jgi:hypothetical protein